MKGIPVNLDGEDVYLVPIEIGPIGKRKREAMNRLTAAEEGDADWEQVSGYLFEFAKALLVQNYGEEKAEDIAARIPLGWAEDLIHLALKARLPADFTNAPVKADSG